MNWIKSCLLFLVSISASSGNQGYSFPEYSLFYATNDGRFTHFYAANFTLNYTQEILRSINFASSLSGIFITPDGKVMFWGYNNGNYVGRYKFTNSRDHVMGFGNVKDTDKAFIGPGYLNKDPNDRNDEIYLYSSGTIYVYDYFSKANQRNMTALENLNELRFLNRHPCNAELAYFIDCSSSPVKGYAYDLRKDTVMQSFDLPHCFDALQFIEQGIKVYAVKDSTIYEADSYEGPYRQYFVSGETIVKMAARDGELFYTTKTPNKLIALRKSSVNGALEEKAYHIDKPITALALYHAHPTMC